MFNVTMMSLYQLKTGNFSGNIHICGSLVDVLAVTMPCIICCSQDHEDHKQRSMCMIAAHESMMCYSKLAFTRLPSFSWSHKETTGLYIADAL